MRIGELSRLSGVSRTALRYYEDAGLLRRPQRTESGYRSYDDDAVARLAFIRAAQGVGLSLAQIREVLSIRDGGRAPCHHVLDLVAQRRDETRSRIRELRALERDLNGVLQAGDELNPAECDPSGICGVIPLN